MFLDCWSFLCANVSERSRPVDPDKFHGVSSTNKPHTAATFQCNYKKRLKKETLYDNRFKSLIKRAHLIMINLAVINSYYRQIWMPG